MAKITTKDKLLSAALDLFSKKGYDGTSVDEIAESIGIKGPNLYKYFKGKEALLQEIGVRAEEGYRKNMGMHSDQRGQIRSAADLKEFSLRQLQYTMNDSTIQKLRKLYSMEQFRSQEFAMVATKHQYDNMIEMFTPIFASLIQQGIMIEGNAEKLAFEYIAPITLLIEINDRGQREQGEILQRIEEHIDFFISHCFNQKEK